MSLTKYQLFSVTNNLLNKTYTHEIYKSSHVELRNVLHVNSILQ